MIETVTSFFLTPVPAFFILLPLLILTITLITFIKKNEEVDVTMSVKVADKLETNTPVYTDTAAQNTNILTPVTQNNQEKELAGIAVSTENITSINVSKDETNTVTTASTTTQVV